MKWEAISFLDYYLYFRMHQSCLSGFGVIDKIETSDKSYSEVIYGTNEVSLLKYVSNKGVVQGYKRINDDN